METSTVLVVEDEREIRELLRRYVERAGFTVRTTGSGVRGHPDCSTRAVSTLSCSTSGCPMSTASRCCARPVPTAGVPVVVLTARSDVADRIRGLELGADDYVTKPFSPTEVVLRVQAVLHRTRGDTDPEAPRRSATAGCASTRPATRSVGTAGRWS